METLLFLLLYDVLGVCIVHLQAKNRCSYTDVQNVSQLKINNNICLIFILYYRDIKENLEINLIKIILIKKFFIRIGSDIKIHIPRKYSLYIHMYVLLSVKMH